MKKVWLITGSSRGLGRSITAAALAGGDLVAATARNPEVLNDLVAQYPEQVYPQQLDVTNSAAIATVVTNTIAKFGRIDVLVNNAGFGILGAAEAYSEEQVAVQLHTNLYAPITLTRAVLPYMRQQRSGHIIQISSLGGRAGNAALTIYQAAKFGLSGFSEALAKEVRPLGIWVTSVEPGGFRTDIFSDMDIAPVIPGYETTVGARTEMFKSSTFNPPGDPEKAATAILRLVNSSTPPVHLLLGSDALKRLEQVMEEHQQEMEKWRPLSISTDTGD
ncbi:MAG: SDR family NAD(P)-dependent oxidoreductase [Chitinophaga sp.]|uniref:SDR family NAD(P)-dependent oxidoreductase n=1 Tax=Chitinophaga sp. TaxID=1869181 RepID=UPI001B091266|nr:SDR family NAD(P)-dependent oxidoreductase [Chitinophaga sp.]MBO9728428.1 SDR family NAD(P)-dependent oxidoreductase [Chitinophaga sp.]